ncbi:recombinase family protein [Helicobacter marmotae]|uniref:Invertase n=1 Tax=Helicobacter marmotae TaxID=152490 RepID=A0A3D8I748_9HELI|nr:recombinase family protein [Helicobacter marmotae]RDU60937.1 invertase [Helicobacter marmotae]
MTYAYLRVSTGKQTNDNQHYEIEKYCKERHIKIDELHEETCSGKVNWKARKLGDIMNKVKAGDTIVVAEISRLGRSILQIMGVLNLCMERGVRIFSIKENYELGDNISSKVLAFAFGLSAEIERQLISQRTKEALALRKAQGVKLGRKKGSLDKVENMLLYNRLDEIINLRASGMSLHNMAKRMKCNRKTIAYILKRMIDEQKERSRERNIKV